MIKAELKKGRMNQAIPPSNDCYMRKLTAKIFIPLYMLIRCIPHKRRALHNFMVRRGRQTMNVNTPYSVEMADLPQPCLFVIEVLA